MKIDPILTAYYFDYSVSKNILEYNMLSSDEHTITSREVYRKKYLDWLAFYKSNDIFHDYSKLIINKLNNEQADNKQHL